MSRRSRCSRPSHIEWAHIEWAHIEPSHIEWARDEVLHIEPAHDAAVRVSGNHPWIGVTRARNAEWHSEGTGCLGNLRGWPERIDLRLAPAATQNRRSRKREGISGQSGIRRPV